MTPRAPRAFRMPGPLPAGRRPGDSSRRRGESEGAGPSGGAGGSGNAHDIAPSRGPRTPTDCWPSTPQPPRPGGLRRGVQGRGVLGRVALIAGALVLGIGALIRPAWRERARALLRRAARGL